MRGSVLVEGGTVAVVSESTTLDVPAGTLHIDGHGGALFPGFADTHCHPFGLGHLRNSLDLRGTSNITSIRLRLFAAIQKAGPGEWVVGRGWDQEALSERRLPASADIDDMSGDNPVVLTRVCGHISLLNSRAIQMLGLDAKNRPGYDRDDTGNLTGIVREGAQEEVFAKMPEISPRSCLANLLSVEFEAAKFGLTTLHCILSEDSYRQELEALESLVSSGTSSLRYRVYVPVGSMKYIATSGLRGKLNNDRVRIAGVKVYTDGSLGASTAALREPYTDDPGNSGVLRYNDEELSDIADRADGAGYQIIIHAIGDRAVEQALEALSRVSGGGNPRRHRVEHASLLPRDLRAKMKKHNIHATVQPCFVTSDAWATQRLGEDRLEDLYPFRSMMEDGIVASGSSDAPVETLSPVVGMWASMTRREPRDPEAINFLQAIELYTTNAARNGFVEEVAQIEEGGRADFTLLDSDVEEMHPAMFRKVGVAATVVDGEMVYSFEGNG